MHCHSVSNTAPLKQDFHFIFMQVHPYSNSWQSTLVPFLTRFTPFITLDDMADCGIKHYRMHCVASDQNKATGRPPHVHAYVNIFLKAQCQGFTSCGTSITTKMIQGKSEMGYSTVHNFLEIGSKKYVCEGGRKRFPFRDSQ